MYDVNLLRSFLGAFGTMILVISAAFVLYVKLFSKKDLTPALQFDHTNEQNEKSPVQHSGSRH